MQPVIVLIVEDHRPTLQGLQQIFHEVATTVIACATFEEAREAILTLDVNVLLSDVRLGPFNGLQLAIIARHRDPNMRILMFSGTDDPVLRAEADLLDATYLLKPLNPVHLLRLCGFEDAGAPDPSANDSH